MSTVRTEELERTKLGNGMWKPGVRLVGIRNFLQQGRFVRCLFCTGKRFGGFASEDLECNESIFTKISLTDVERLETARYLLTPGRGQAKRSNIGPIQAS